jgi:carbon-monoxide dehydrogenase medium subunit
VKPAAFEYEDPAEVDEALALLGRHGEEAKVLAGGQSLVPLMNFRLARPGVLVDINRIRALDSLRLEDGTISVGALTRQARLERSPEIAARLPVLLEAVRLIGHSQIRNRGTVGGSVAHADPAAELPTLFAALDASFRVRSQRGERWVGWREFFVAPFVTALEPDELLVEVRASLPAEGCGWAFLEFARRHGDFALGGACALLHLAPDGTCGSASLALLAAGPTPYRADAAERALVGRAPDSRACQEAAALAVEGISPTGDIHGSAEYRKHLIQTLSRRALTAAAERATGGSRS